MSCPIVQNLFQNWPIYPRDKDSLLHLYIRRFTGEFLEMKLKRGMKSLIPVNHGDVVILSSSKESKTIVKAAAYLQELSPIERFKGLMEHYFLTATYSYEMFIGIIEYDDKGRNRHSELNVEEKKKK